MKLVSPSPEAQIINFKLHKKPRKFRFSEKFWLLTAVFACASSDLQLKAAEVNKTLSRNDGSPDKSLNVMKEDIQTMLSEMRERQLAGQKSIAEDELEYGHTHKQPHQLVRTVHTCTRDDRAVLMKVFLTKLHKRDW